VRLPGFPLLLHARNLVSHFLSYVSGKLSLEKVSEEDRNNDSDEESSESSSTTETHSMHLDVPRHSQDASSDSVRIFCQI
jgi:hypothetical protein